MRAMCPMKILPFAACVWTFCACTTEGGPNGLTDTGAEAISESTETAEALAALKEMSEFLADQQHLSFEADVNFDVVQPVGHKLEFGSTRNVTLRRPDRVYLAVRHRDGFEQFLYFDGTSLSVLLPSRNAYAREEIPGTVTAALDTLVEELGVPAPLGDLIHPSLYSELAKEIESGLWVGEELLGGVVCDHFVFRTPEVDFQLWIEQGDHPLPHRLVITYRQHPGAPQFRAQLREWNIAADTPELLFSFNPPADAERLSFPKLFELSEPVAAGEQR